MNLKPLRDLIASDLEEAKGNVMTGDQVVRLEDAATVALKAVKAAVEYGANHAQKYRELVTLVSQVAAVVYHRDATRGGTTAEAAAKAFEMVQVVDQEIHDSQMEPDA